MRKKYWGSQEMQREVKRNIDYSIHKMNQIFEKYPGQIPYPVLKHNPGEKSPGPAQEKVLKRQNNKNGV